MFQEFHLKGVQLKWLQINQDRFYRRSKHLLFSFSHANNWKKLKICQLKIIRTIALKHINEEIKSSKILQRMK